MAKSNVTNHLYDVLRVAATVTKWSQIWGKSVNTAFTVLMVVASIVFQTHRSPVEASDRVEPGLLVRYDFSEGHGETIHDRSGVGEPLHLTIEKNSGIRWSKGMLSVESSALIASVQPARKVIDAVKKSNAITIEAWLKPAGSSQSGPARIISLSADTSQRNVTLGQDKELYDVRLRTTGSDRNGMPSTSSPQKSLQTRLTHAVFTRAADGVAIIYIDGKQSVRKNVSGNFGNWNDEHRLLLANEATKDRLWLGELHLVAIYDQALSAREVEQNFAAGLSHEPSPPL